MALPDLLRVLEHPARGFLKQRLGVAVTRAEDEPQEALPVGLDGLESYGVAERVLQDRLRGVPPDECRRRERRRGAVPPGQLGDASLDAAVLRAEQVLAASAVERARDPESYDVDVLVDGVQLLGTVTGVRGTALLSTTCATLSPRHRLHAWVQLVALSVAHPDRGWTAVAVGRGGKGVKRSVQGPLAADEASAVLAQLLALYGTALTCPLPLPVKAGAEYAHARSRGRSVQVARAMAVKEWDGSERVPGERANPEHVLLHGEDAPLDVLTRQPLLPAEVAEVDEDDRFGLLSRRLWQPLLDHERTEVA